jgi:hypothetical protein
MAQVMDLRRATMPPPPSLPRRRNIESVQADLRKNIGGSPERAATPRAVCTENLIRID